MGNDFIYSSGADLGFLDGGSIYKRGFDLLILPDYLLIFPDFLKILHENEIIFSQRGFKWSSKPFEPPLDPPLQLLIKQTKISNTSSLQRKA